MPLSLPTEKPMLMSYEFQDRSSTHLVTLFILKSRSCLD